MITVYVFFFISPMMKIFMMMIGASTPQSRQGRDLGDACETIPQKIGFTDVRELFQAKKWVSVVAVQCKWPGLSCSANSCPTRGHECM